MSATLTFLLVLSVTLSAVVQIFTDPRITRKFVLKSVAAILIYFAHAAVGGLAVYFLVPFRPSAAYGVALAFVGWLGLGMLGLIRFAPHLRTPPKVLMNFGIADLICLLMIGIGLYSAISP